MTSIALKRLGHNVTILERSPTPLLHDQGAGIVAGGEVQNFMSIYDKTKRQIAVTSQQRLYLNHGGEIVQRETTAQRMTSWDLLYNLCRANFDHISSEYLEGKPVPAATPDEGSGTYRHGQIVTSLQDTGSKVQISYRDIRDGRDSQGSTTADLVIVADGQSSQMREQLSPASHKRTYAGYVAFRGTVDEGSLSPDASAVFVENFPFYHGKDTQILAYSIPGVDGILSQGKRKINWVWYVNVPDDSEHYRDIMTDKDGNLHRFSLPAGGHMRAHVWEEQKKHADKVLPPQYRELIHNTENPFVQAITDLEPPKTCQYLEGKVVMVGDALSGFRPHTAASTSQAAFHALSLRRVFSGEIGWKAYEESVLEFAASWQRKGVMLGNRSQFGEHPMQD